jgi:cytochrome b subunit of formate dehydrogenase
MTPETLERPADRESTPVPQSWAAPQHLRRFDAKTRGLHVVVMTTFLGLAATGMPLLFSDAPWAGALARLFGGFHGAGLVHRAFGTALLLAVAWHVLYVLWRAFVRGEHGILWGPDSLIPQPRDVVQLWQQLKWFAEKGPPPKFERFTYWEKFDYWAVLWGTSLMGAAGLVLWFPIAASRVLPGWMFNLALFVHGAEATLAIVFIFVVHFFNGHLRPGKFPMDMVIFTGSVSEAELKHERAGQYERLVAARTIGLLATKAPTPKQIARGRVLGTLGLTIGLALFVLILYATLR